MNCFKINKIFSLALLISDLTIEGKSSDQVRVFAYMKFESSNNQSTADVNFKLYAGSALIDQFTETLENPCGGFFSSGCAWVSYQINLDVSSDGYDVASGEQIKIDIEATADCEGGGGFGEDMGQTLAWGHPDLGGILGGDGCIGQSPSPRADSLCPTGPRYELLAHQ